MRDSDADTDTLDLETRMREGFDTSAVPEMGIDADALLARGRSARTRRQVVGGALGLAVAGVGAAVWTQLRPVSGPVVPAGTITPSASTRPATPTAPASTPAPSTPATPAVPTNPEYLGTKRLPPSGGPKAPEDGPGLGLKRELGGFDGPLRTVFEIKPGAGRDYPQAGDPVVVRFGVAGSAPVSTAIPAAGTVVRVPGPATGSRAFLVGGQFCPAGGASIALGEMQVVQDSSGRVIVSLVALDPKQPEPKALYLWKNVERYEVLVSRPAGKVAALFTTKVDLGVAEPALIAEDPTQQSVVVIGADVSQAAAYWRQGVAMSRTQARGGVNFSVLATDKGERRAVFLPEGATLTSHTVQKTWPYVIGGEMSTLTIFEVGATSREVIWTDAQGTKHVTTSLD